MDYGVLVRRGFHLMGPAWLVWYWAPPDAWVGVPKEAFLFLFLGGALLIEAARHLLKFRVFGLREYEARQISGYAWGAIGLALGLLFFPGELVIPTFWGMAWIDPVCAYTKKGRGYPWIPLAAYLVLFSVLSLVVVPLAPYQTVPLAVARLALYAPLAAAIAVAVEKPNLKLVDDDFLMTVVPLLVLAGLSRIG